MAAIRWTRRSRSAPRRSDPSGRPPAWKSKRSEEAREEDVGWRDGFNLYRATPPGASVIPALTRRIEKSRDVQRIIEDDQYQEVRIAEVLPGDVVIYYSEGGDPNHSGVVMEVGGTLVTPIVCSKWGNAGEFVHGLRDCPNVYGPDFRFFRCRL